MKSIKSVFFPSIEDSPGRVHHRSQDSARERLTGRGKGGKWRGVVSKSTQVGMIRDSSSDSLVVETVECGGPAGGGESAGR